MLAQKSGILSLWFVTLAALAWLAPPLSGQEALRRIHVGDTMPEFSLHDANGTTVQYSGKETRVLAVVILQAKQNQLERLVTDIEVLVQTLKSETTVFDCVGVISGPGAGEYLRRRDSEAGKTFPIFADPNFAFWGKVGAVAAPTAIVVGADHKVQWTKAGYGYDFVAGLHAQLGKALGLAGSTDTSGRVETLDNGSARARRDRQVQLARALARKGRLESAMAELEKMHEADPNAVDVALELGEVLCRAGRNDAALKMATQVKPESNPDKARAMLVCAWARRQMGDLDAAEALLVKALALDPASPRLLYERGKVCQIRGDAGMALACYRRALAEVFGDADTAGSSQK